MPSFQTVGLSTIALMGVLQLCPAPQEIILPIVGAVVGGAVSGGISAGISNAKMMFVKRDYPPGISQESIDLCVGQIDDQAAAGTTVNIYDTSDTSARVDNVPAACMDLATVLTGEPAQAGGPVPVPMGSASLEYQGLSNADRQSLANALKARN